MPKVLKIKKGIMLRLKGAIPPKVSIQHPVIASIAMTPDDFPGIIPKIDVSPGDIVAIGTPLWHDKNDPDIKVVSPVAGTVRDVVRGEKRKLLRVVVDVCRIDTLQREEETAPADVAQIKGIIKNAGLWAMMRQLPFDIVPVDNRIPVNIFITAWDSAPLAAGYDYYFTDARRDYLVKGVHALASLTTGKVFIGYRAGDSFPELNDAETIAVEGDYPASLPSVLAANTVPVNKGDTVWLMGVETVVRIGQAVTGAPVDWTFPVAVTGSELKEPCISMAPAGASVTPLLELAMPVVESRHIRIISGNVFTGEKVDYDGFLRYPYRQLTVIPEGDDKAEFMGWASVSPGKMSKSRSFPAFFMKSRIFAPDARLNGGRRSIIMSGEYDRYIPMDILAEYLIKAILARDVERMESLGIYEVTPADFSAAEYADTSKLELQKIVREGLDYMVKEVGTAD